MCILVPAPYIMESYLYQFSAVVQKMLFFGLLAPNCIMFDVCLFSIMILKVDAGIASSSSIWDEFNEQYQHQSIKSTMLKVQLAHFWCI